MDPLLGLTFALALAALFASSALHQFWTFRQWISVVRRYELVAQGLSAPLAVLVTAALFVTAGALSWPPTRPQGGVAAAALLSLFAGAMWINIRRGRTAIDCGCFGARSRAGIAPWMVWRNVLLALIALLLTLPRGARALSLLDLAACAGCVLTLAFLYPVVAVVLRPTAISRPEPALHAPRVDSAASPRSGS
jgi:hypothetical protein